MSVPLTINGTLPDGTRHRVTLAQITPDTVAIVDDAWAPNASSPHEQRYTLTDVKRAGDVVTATLRVFLFPAKVVLTLFADHVQLVAPGHYMSYPVTPAEHAQAEAFLAGFKEVE